MNTLVFLFLCMAAGAAARRFRRLPASAPEVLGAFIINVSLPAITLVNLHKIAFSSSLAFPSLMPWIQFLLGALFFLAVGRALRWDRKRVAAATLVCALGNTSFIGFPMVEALLGKEAVGVATFVDQLGTFLVLSTLGITVANAAAGGRVGAREIAARILRFPPFWALLLGFALRPAPFPEWLSLSLDRLGATLTPIALFTVGFQLRFHFPAAARALFAIGMLFKLLLAPLFFWALARAWFGGAYGSDPAVALVARTTILEAAMAPMISAGIVAEQLHLADEVVPQWVGWGILLSLATVPLWNAVL